MPIFFKTNCGCVGIPVEGTPAGFEDHSYTITVGSGFLLLVDACDKGQDTWDWNAPSFHYRFIENFHPLTPLTPQEELALVKRIQSYLVAGENLKHIKRFLK